MHIYIVFPFVCNGDMVDDGKMYIYITVYAV